MENANNKPKKQGFLIFTTGHVDMWFCILVIILLGIGLVMMFSASYATALYEEGDALEYFRKQAGFAAGGLVAMYAASRVHYRTYRRFSKIILIISFVLLVVVLFYHTSNADFKRWIPLPGGITFQPSEIAKLGLIWFLAWSLEYEQYQIRSKDWKLLLVYCAMIAFMSGLVLLENHVSGAILIFFIGITMTYMGGFKKRWYIIGGILLLVAAVIAVMEREHMHGKILGKIGIRLIAWLDPTFEPTGARWQINQSLRAIGSGGLFGTGLGQSKQKHFYVSEPHNDFIFAIVCEELGYIGAMVIMLLFVLLIWRGFVIALHAESKFAGLFAAGIMFQIGFQTALNICVVTGVMPDTGISLPFFSFGGTSMLMILGQMGIVLSVSRSSKIKKNTIL